MRLYISYRLDDKGFVGRMRLHLQELLPVLEVKQSDPRVNVETIDSIIKDIDVVLVVIGANWLRTNKQSARILNSPDDYVYCELSAALKYAHIRIAPLLIDGARMPGKQDLPFEVSAFATINAATIKHASFEKDLMEVVETLRSPGDESSWFPSVEYGTIQIRSKAGGFIKHYLETDYPPVTVIIDGEEVGTMQLINKTFQQNVMPGEHVVTLKPTDRTIRQCECRVFIRQGQTSVLYAERNPFWGTLSIKY
jgi:hypothetical protein